jgi:hypothetical protein
VFTVFSILLAMLGIVLLACLVVLYVAYPHRGEEVPGAPWLGDAVKRGVDTVGELMDRPGNESDRHSRL